MKNIFMKKKIRANTHRKSTMESFFFFSNLSTWLEIIVKRAFMQEGHTCMMQVRTFQKDMFFFPFFFSSSLILVETSDLTLTGKETLDGKVYC